MPTLTLTSTSTSTFTPTHTFTLNPHPHPHTHPHPHQVLSHADSRARYDAKGKEGLEEVNFMEASTFYQARP